MRTAFRRRVPRRRPRGRRARSIWRGPRGGPGFLASCRFDLPYRSLLANYWRSSPEAWLQASTDDGPFKAEKIDARIRKRHRAAIGWRARARFVSRFENTRRKTQIYNIMCSIIYSSKDGRNTFNK